MTNEQLFYYIIGLIAVCVFVYMILRTKGDTDFLQEQKGDKKINSTTRIGFLTLIGFTIWYCAYKTVHDKEISDTIVLLFLGVAFGGKAGIDAIKKEKKP